ncbi:MAG TPA: diguanylate cyclase [Cellulomonas sp.]
MPAQSGPDPIDELGAQLAESRRLLRSVIDQVPAMIGYWNRDLHNVLANEAYVDWFGMSPDEILGIHIREVLGEELFELNLPYMQAALGGVAQHFDRTIVDASGETRYSQADYVPDVDAAGRVIGFFVLVSDVTARTKAEMALVPLLAELEHRAMTDPLTGLANRRELTRRSEVALTDLGGHEPGTRFVGLLVLDLDGFKSVNDLLGHDSGDELLIIVGRRLAGAVRDVDVVARVGGDEFAILIPDLADPLDANRLADRLLPLLRQPIRLGPGRDELVRIDASVGVVAAAAGTPDLALRSLLREADRRMYLAKNARVAL